MSRSSKPKPLSEEPQLNASSRHDLLCSFCSFHSSTANFLAMGLFDKFKTGLQKTHSRLTHELKRIVTRSPRLDAEALEQLEAALIASDLGVETTNHIVEAVRKTYETQGSDGLDVFGVAEREVQASLAS